MKNSEEKILVKRYVLVARKLAKTAVFTQSKVLADELGMEPKKFRASVMKAKELAATHGIMISNKMHKSSRHDSTGYKTASFEEFSIEIHKSCARATAHILQALKLVSLVEKSGKINRDFESLKNILISNVRSISFPNVDKEFNDYGELIPDFVSDYAEDEVEDQDE